MGSEIASLVFLAALLGVSSYGAGMVPLFFVLSGRLMSVLAASASGLLLGIGLGVIIPEGVEAIAKARKPGGSSEHADFPTTTIAVSLLVGFTFMLVTEQLLPGAHSHMPMSHTFSPRASTVEFDADAELGEVGRPATASDLRSPTTRTIASDGLKVSGKGFTLTLGLVLHALSDGLALGSSIVAGTKSQQIIAGALVIHKAPTALALTTSLLASGVTREDCKKYLAIFSASTPAGATLACLFLWFFQSADGDNNDWTGIAMLISGGSFLYVATVLQPVSSGNTGGLPREDEISMKFRLVNLVSGMFLPVVLSALVGHGHS